MPPALREPCISVSNQALLASVSHLQRKHLGSQLYTTKVGLAPTDSTSVDAKFLFKSTMKPIPRFEGKENCTFTIRVPRAYLLPTDTPEHARSAILGGLEEICRTRAVWGTEVYTDDSDVVAAAVHSGWLQGDFGEFNEDIHDLFNSNRDDQAAHSPTAAVVSNTAANTAVSPPLKTLVTAKPPVPFQPPANADLHVTILLLPPLTHYTASTSHHLRSREWGSDHDGMSYMIHGVEFVDEGPASRYTERGGKGRRERIKEEERRREEAARALMGLLGGASSGSDGVGFGSGSDIAGDTVGAGSGEVAVGA